MTTIPEAIAKAQQQLADRVKSNHLWADPTLAALLATLEAYREALNAINHGYPIPGTRGEQVPSMC